MNSASEVRLFSVMKQTRKRYNNLFKAQVVKDHLKGAKFEDLAKQYGPCDDRVSIAFVARRDDYPKSGARSDLYF